MKPAAYFSRITPISLHDPLAELLGATEDGIITYDFLDAVKLAGHACPTVAGAWLATVRGLRALYGDDMPVRGNNRQFADNWELSAQRALTVTRTLIEEGVPSTAIFAAAFGSQQPVADNADPEGRARNRRVEMAPVPKSSTNGKAGND